MSRKDDLEIEAMVHEARCKADRNTFRVHETRKPHRLKKRSQEEELLILKEYRARMSRILDGLEGPMSLDQKTEFDKLAVKYKYHPEFY
jgi:hypothetical protein